MRRGRGVAGVLQKQKADQKAKTLGSDVASLSIVTMKNQLETFKLKLEEFSVKHKDKINNNPLFRAQFQKLCNSIGIDPLVSTSGFWSQNLRLGDFYFRLSVEIVEICLRTKPHNGGLLALSDLTDLLNAKRQGRASLSVINTGTVNVSSHNNASTDITANDISLALDKLTILDPSYKVIELNGTPYVVSVPVELRVDHIALISLFDKLNGFLTPDVAIKELKWSRDRVITAIEQLLVEGFIWEDAQGETKSYWVPSIWQQHITTASQSN